MVTIQIKKEKGKFTYSETEFVFAAQEVQWEDDYQPGEKLMFAILHNADCPALDDKECNCHPTGCIFQEKKRAEVEEYWSKGGMTKPGELLKIWASSQTTESKEKE